MLRTRSCRRGRHSGLLRRSPSRAPAQDGCPSQSSRIAVEREHRRCEQARSYFTVNLMSDAFRKSGFHAMCPTFHVWFLLWKFSLFFQYLTPDYFWQDTDSLLVASECLNVLISLKRLKKNLSSKVSLSSLKAHFNLIVWHSHSRNETLCGKIKTAATLKWSRARKYKPSYSKIIQFQSTDPARESPTRLALKITTHGKQEVICVCDCQTLCVACLQYVMDVCGCQSNYKRIQVTQRFQSQPRAKEASNTEQTWNKVQGTHTSGPVTTCLDILELMSGQRYQVREFEQSFLWKQM